MKRIVTTAAVMLLAGAACATREAPPVILDSPPQILAGRLAGADRLAARGCYLCLKEAAAVYEALLNDSSDGIVARKALENYLMVALREIELRIPDSGARDAARALQPRVSSSYAAHFALLDSNRDQRIALATTLEKEWPASAMKAYFYLTAAIGAAKVKELKAQVDQILATHSQDLSLKYRMQAFLPTFSEEASRALIGQETGFGEVHFLLGQRAVLDARLADAHRELTRAAQLLPDSAAISLVFANVTMSFARYADALRLYERVLAQPDARHNADPEAQLGRARALSYLRRHTEAIAALDELLRNLQDNPGEKYYWRAWNRLRLGETQAAYQDAVAALKAMRNNEVYRLAGIAAFGINRLSEARGYFDDALKINGGDCDSQRFLAQIDASERTWKPAFNRFSSAVACYDRALVRMRKELSEHEMDISGLSNGLIATLRVEIQETQSLRAITASNAAIAAKNSGTDAP